MIHRILGILLSIFFILIVTGNSDSFLGFQKLGEAKSGYLGGKVARGESYVYLAMIGACYCFIFPGHLVKKWNPWSPFKVGDTYPKSFFIFLGYLFTLIAFFLMYIFSN